MIWRTLADYTAEHALNGTSVVNTIALLKGASILRVHDVRKSSARGHCSHFAISVKYQDRFITFALHDLRF
jgi:hypothetical protein